MPGKGAEAETKTAHGGGGGGEIIVAAYERKHKEPPAPLLALLRRHHVPHALPLLRRLEFAARFPGGITEHACVLWASDVALPDAVEAGAGAVFAAGYLDLSRSKDILNSPPPEGAFISHYPPPLSLPLSLARVYDVLYMLP